MIFNPLLIETLVFIPIRADRDFQSPGMQGNGEEIHFLYFIALYCTIQLFPDIFYQYQ